jgi:hypothetical protein
MKQIFRRKKPPIKVMEKGDQRLKKGDLLINPELLRRLKEPAIFISNEEMEKLLEEQTPKIVLKETIPVAKPVDDWKEIKPLPVVRGIVNETERQLLQIANVCPLCLKPLTNGNTHDVIFNGKTTPVHKTCPEGNITQ